jgi:hypothetical protein
MDFRVDAKNSIEFCDPLNPQFIPVVAVVSPVVMTLSTPDAKAGERVSATVALKTASGKPIAVEDLLVVHTKRLHLMIVDTALADYQHVHPEPTGAPGEWKFEFMPRRSGAYRIFADFTPTATARGLYAYADLNVLSSTGELAAGGTNSVDVASPSADEFTFALTPSSRPLRAKQPIDLVFSITRKNDGEVPLMPVMDAYAHLVAFNESRSGFAHLHPMQADPLKAPDQTHPKLEFKITIPQPGKYVVWAQVNVAGAERFVPFWFDVE